MEQSDKSLLYTLLGTLLVGLVAILIITINGCKTLDTNETNLESNPMVTYLERTKNIDTISYNNELHKKYIEYKNTEYDRLVIQFKFPLEYKDYLEKLSIHYRIDTIKVLSLCRIESWCGNYPNYKDRTSDRAYYSKTYLDDNLEQLPIWDIGLMQLSTRYETYFRDNYYNPSLIYELTKITTNFELENDLVNLQIGIAYLSYLYYHENINDYEGAIISYNTGIGNYINNKIPKITLDYTHAIVNNWMYRDKKGY